MSEAPSSGLQQEQAPEVPAAERLVASLRASGELEKLRNLALEKLEKDEDLLRRIQEEVQQSRAFRQFSGSRQRELMNQLQHELADDLLPHAVSTLWRVLTDPAEGGGIAQQIDQAVHTALAQQRDVELQRGGQATGRSSS